VTADLSFNGKDIVVGVPEQNGKENAGSLKGGATEE
jgi:hypothetical protein